MAKRRKKTLNKGLAVFCGIIFLIFGLALGALGKIMFLPEDSYVIPNTHNATTSVSVGDINVEEIKSNELSIHFLELGNKYTGDCTFIKVGNTEILIDAGSRTSSIPTINQYITQYITDGKLEYVIVTHAHQDHYAGFATQNSLFDALNTSSVSVGEVITFSKTNQNPNKGLYKTFLAELEEVKIEDGAIVNDVLDYCDTTGATTTIALGNNCELEFLYHKYYETKAPSENDYSVCCIINQGSGANAHHYLFTGDLEEDGEKDLITHTSLPQVDLYKAGHHGSKTSSSSEFLAVIKPKVVCVCACAGSPEYTSNQANQFPTQEFINRISLYTDAVYVTTLCVDYNKGEFESMNGNIVVTTATVSSAVTVKCAGSKEKLKDSEWFKNNRTCPERWAS